jgi:hypothetical protein
MSDEKYRQIIASPQYKTLIPLYGETTRIERSIAAVHKLINTYSKADIDTLLSTYVGKHFTYYSNLYRDLKQRQTRIASDTYKLEVACTPCRDIICDDLKCCYFHTAEQMIYKRQQELSEICRVEASQYCGKYIILGKSIKNAIKLPDELCNMIRQYCANNTYKEVTYSFEYDLARCVINNNLYSLNRYTLPTIVCSAIDCNSQISLYEECYKLFNDVSKDYKLRYFHLECIESVGYVTNISQVCNYIRGDVVYLDKSKFSTINGQYTLSKCEGLHFNRDIIRGCSDQ